MRHVLSILCAIIAVAGLSAPASAQSAQQTVPAQRHTVTSAVLGEDRVVMIRTPANYGANGERYPVLYMTDGPQQFGHTCATIEFLARNRRMPEMIVVGIANTDRTRDLTPTNVKRNGGEGPDPFATSGGADKFLLFVETELIPFVESNYRTQPYRIFAGHSFGGLLAVHALATRPELFNAYIAVSPSLWWDDEVTIAKTEALLKKHKKLDRALYVTIGDEGGNMRTAYDRFQRLLDTSQSSGFAWKALRMEDEDHGSVVLRSHYNGLRFVFDGWRAPVDTQTGAVAGGMKGVEEHYEKLSKRLGYTVAVPEDVLNQLGYQLLAGGKSDDAIAVFKRNVDLYPASANVYDSLGEAYERTGRTDLAREHYEKAVTLATKNGDNNLPLFKANLTRVSSK